MKKVLAVMASLLICVAALAGCASDPVQEDLINYINKQVPTLVPLENKVTSEYASVTGEKYTNDEVMAAKLKDVIIPTNDELLAKSKAIVPATEEVKKVHNKYTAVITEQQEAFNLLLQAIQKGDEAAVKTVNEKLAHSDKVSKEFLADIETLKKDHKVENAK